MFLRIRAVIIAMLLLVNDFNDDVVGQEAAASLRDGAELGAWQTRTMIGVKNQNIRRFQGASESTLSQLMMASSSSLALRAAWQRVVRTLPTEHQKDAALPNRNEVSRFLGFLEGRLQIDAPSAWEAAIVLRQPKGEFSCAMVSLTHEWEQNQCGKHASTTRRPRRCQS